MRTPAQWLAEYAASHDFKEITQKEFDTMCETGIAPSGDAAATTGGTAALEPQQREIQTTPADAEEDAEFEEWPGWMHQKWAEEHPEEGDPA